MPRKDLEARKQYERDERPNKEARRIYMREWSREYKKTQAYRDYQKKYRAEHRRLTKGKKEVLIAESVVEAIWIEQNKCCAICKKTIPLRNFYTHMDHDHETLKLRGLLCSKCNLGLGHFEDNPAYLIAAAEYIKKHAMELTSSNL
jgi:hypothetical protein